MARGNRLGEAFFGFLGFIAKTPGRFFSFIGILLIAFIIWLNHIVVHKPDFNDILYALEEANYKTEVTGYVRNERRVRISKSVIQESASIKLYKKGVEDPVYSINLNNTVGDRKIHIEHHPSGIELDKMAPDNSISRYQYNRIESVLLNIIHVKKYEDVNERDTTAGS